MSDAVIGALRATLSLDGGAFNDGARRVSAQMDGLSRQFEAFGRKVAKVGVGLSAAVTLPLGAIATTSAKTAGSFEAAMNRVQSALTGVTGQELKALEDQARSLGPQVGKGATEAAGGIEMLAKNGLATADIMGGALAASLKLAAAGNADLAPAADLTTDVMQQFGKRAADLPGVVDKVSGAMLASKFGFEDYAQAVGQAGGVAGGVGVSFEDMNTAIAGTSPLFASGSDAGTSFKTFLTALNPTSKEAAQLMDALGLSFFSADGSMKSLADISGILREKIGGLNEQAQNDALKTLFGTDAMRTAIGLMKLGKDGFVDLQRTIGQAKAGDQVAIQQQGYEAAMQRLAAAFENLKIAIGQAGVLDAFTAIANGLTKIVNAIAGISPWIMKLGVGFGALASAIGPVLVVLGTLASFVLPALLVRFGPLFIAISALINPFGTLIALAGRFVTVATGMKVLSSIASLFVGLGGKALAAVTSLKALRIGLLALVGGPWGAALLAIAAAFQALTFRTQAADAASDELKAATSELNRVLADPTATNSAISQAASLVEQRLRASQAARDQAREELKLQRALALGAMFLPGGSAIGSGILGGANQREIRLNAIEAQELWAEGDVVSADLISRFGGAANWAKFTTPRPSKNGGLFLPNVPKEEKNARAERDPFEDDLAALTDRLLPFQAATRAAAADQALLNKALSAGKLSAGQYALATAEIERMLKDSVIGDQKAGIAVLENAIPDLSEMRSVTQGVAEAMAVVDFNAGQASDGFAAMLKPVAELGRRINEDIVGGLMDVAHGFESLGDVAIRILNNIGEAILADLIKPLTSGGGSGGFGGMVAQGLSSVFGLFGGGGKSGLSASITSAGPIGGSAVTLPSLSKLPGFKTGGSFQVGGAGGVDSQLMQFYASPGEMVRISKGENDNGRGAPAVHFDLRGAVMTHDLLAQMNALADGAAVRGAAGGSRMAQSSLAQRQRRRLG